jgi:hypothetical protein
LFLQIKETKTKGWIVHITGGWGVNHLSAVERIQQNGTVRAKEPSILMEKLAYSLADVRVDGSDFHMVREKDGERFYCRFMYPERLRRDRQLKGCSWQARSGIALVCFDASCEFVDETFEDMLPFLNWCLGRRGGSFVTGTSYPVVICALNASKSSVNLNSSNSSAGLDGKSNHDVDVVALARLVGCLGWSDAMPDAVSSLRELIFSLVPFLIQNPRVEKPVVEKPVVVKKSIFKSLISFRKTNSVRNDDIVVDVNDIPVLPHLFQKQIVSKEEFWRLACRRDIETDCPELVSLVRWCRISLTWSVTTHLAYPIAVRKRIEILWMIWRRRGFPVVNVPRDVLVLLCQAVATP